MNKDSRHVSRRSELLIVVSRRRPWGLPVSPCTPSAPSGKVVQQFFGPPRNTGRPLDQMVPLRTCCTAKLRLAGTLISNACWLAARAMSAHLSRHKTGAPIAFFRNSSVIIGFQNERFKKRFSEAKPVALFIAQVRGTTAPGRRTIRGHVYPSPQPGA